MTPEDRQLQALEYQTPGTIQDLEDGRRIVWGEMKITYENQGDSIVCHVAQEYKIIQEVWTARIVTGE